MTAELCYLFTYNWMICYIFCNFLCLSKSKEYLDLGDEKQCQSKYKISKGSTCEQEVLEDIFCIWWKQPNRTPPWFCTAVTNNT